jgi:hypothetical protein
MQYGWPKNLLHWSGIHESILDICATVTIHFVIADGSTAMGGARQLGEIVPANDPVAADATCERLMGFDPLQVRHLADGRHFLGNLREDRIRMLAEGVGPFASATCKKLKSATRIWLGDKRVGPLLLRRVLFRPFVSSCACPALLTAPILQPDFPTALQFCHRHR